MRSRSTVSWLASPRLPRSASRRAIGPRLGRWGLGKRTALYWPRPPESVSWRKGHGIYHASQPRGTTARHLHPVCHGNDGANREARSSPDQDHPIARIRRPSSSCGGRASLPSAVRPSDHSRISIGSEKGGRAQGCRCSCSCCCLRIQTVPKNHAPGNVGLECGD